MGSETVQVTHKTEPPIAYVCSLIKFLFYAWLCIILNHNFLGHEKAGLVLWHDNFIVPVSKNTPAITIHLECASSNI